MPLPELSGWRRAVKPTPIGHYDGMLALARTVRCLKMRPAST